MAEPTMRNKKVSSSSFPVPASLLHPSYSLPTFPIEKVGLCNLEKIPMFLFRAQTRLVQSPESIRVRPREVTVSEFFLGEVSRDDSVDHMEILPSPLQCIAKVKIPQCDSTSLNMLDCQMISLGHQYKMICWSPEGVKTVYKRVAFLPLNKGEEFAVLLQYTQKLLLLTSARRKWIEIKNVPPECRRIVPFRGRFYANFTNNNNEIFVIDTYSLEATSLMPTPPLNANNYLVPSGNDELFLVEESRASARQFAFRVSRLDEKDGRWVEVSDLGDRVLFITNLGNFSCSAKELPDGCGVIGNSILFTTRPGDVTFFYKYDDIKSCWRLPKENGVTIHYASSVLAFRVSLGTVLNRTGRPISGGSGYNYYRGHS